MPVKSQESPHFSLPAYKSRDRSDSNLTILQDLPTTPILLVDQAELTFAIPGHCDMILSAVTVSLVDLGVTAKYYGVQWKAPSDGTCTIKLSRAAGALLDAKNHEIKPIRSWFVQEIMNRDLVVLVISAHDCNNVQVSTVNIEIIPVSDEVMNLANALGRKGHLVADYTPMLMSSMRFKYFLCGQYTSFDLKGKKVFVSGCSAGSEARMVMELGASYCAGVDTDADCIRLAQKRYLGIKKLDFFPLIAIFKCFVFCPVV